MNISKDGKTLYFSDEEIDNDTNGEKKVFVTKRINGKESHVKAEKQNVKPKKMEIDTFDFSDEFVLGVNEKENKEQKRSKKSGKHHKNIKKFEKEYKLHKSRKKYKKAIAFFSIIGLVVAIGIIALTAPIFNIVNIEVEGNDVIPYNTIITLSNLKVGENIFRFNNSVCENVMENKYIQEVKIKRKLPDTIIIYVEERSPKYQVNLINGYTYIDKNGYILENSTVKKDVPIIVGLSISEEELLKEKRLKLQDLEKLNKILKIMEATRAIDIEDLISEINVEDESNYVLDIESEDKKVYIGDTSNLTNKMLYVQKILEKEKDNSGIVFVNGDISSGFKPYFREGSTET